MRDYVIASALRRLSLLVMLAAAVAAHAQHQPRGTGAVAGRVIDASTGDPIAGAKVTLIDEWLAPDVRPASITTDERGGFRYAAVPFGRYHLAASKPRYVDGAYGKYRPHGDDEPLDVTPAEHGDLVDLIVWREAHITGTVFDGQRAPVTGARVWALEMSPYYAEPLDRPAGVATITTDDRGRFDLAVPPGAYLVAVPMPVPTDDVDLRTRLFRSAGHVDQIFQDTDIAPPPLAPSADRNSYVTTLAPSATEFDTAAVMTVQAGDVRSNVDVTMQRRAIVRASGIVAGPNGPADVWLELRSTAAPLSPTNIATYSRPDGSFTFPAAPAGRYLIRAVRDHAHGDDVTSPNPDGWWGLQPIDLDERSADDLHVRLTAGGIVNLRVRFSGTPSVPSPGPAWDASLVGIDGRTVCCARGTNDHVSFDGVPAGRYVLGLTVKTPWTLSWAMVDGRDVTSGPFDVASGATVSVDATLTTTPGSLSGTVTGERGPAGQDTTVVVFPVNPDTRVALRPPLAHRLQASRVFKGRYVVSGLPSGEYFVSAVSESRLDDWPSPELLRRLEVDAARVTLANGERKTVDLRAR